MNEIDELIAAGIPSALAKAAYDPFFYALGFRVPAAVQRVAGRIIRRDGTVIGFESAQIDGEWITLSFGAKCCNAEGVFGVLAGPLERLKIPLGFCYERGLDVRLSEITWFAMLLGARDPMKATA